MLSFSMLIINLLWHFKEFVVIFCYGDPKKIIYIKSLLLGPQKWQVLYFFRAFIFVMAHDPRWSDLDMFKK